MLSMASITVCNIINILGRRRQFVCTFSILILKDHSDLFFHDNGIFLLLL